MTPGHTALIALVDDDDAVRDSLALLLRLHGFATREFASGEAFLEWAGTEPTDCVLLDLRMPGASGLDVQAELARREVGWPIVMLTAHGDVATTRAALKAGAFDFIEKPFDDEVLLKAIHAASTASAERRAYAARLSPRCRASPRLMHDRGRACGPTRA